MALDSHSVTQETILVERLTIPIVQSNDLWIDRYKKMKQLDTVWLRLYLNLRMGMVLSHQELHQLGTFPVCGTI